MTRGRGILAALALACAVVPASAGDLLPPERSPADEPAATILALDDLTSRAIRMFDAAEASARHYDLVACLDGLTFGFANAPQSRLLEFMTGLAADRGGATYRTFVMRLVEHFREDDAAWSAFVARTGAADAPRSEDNVAGGLRRTLLNPQFMRPYRKAFTNRASSQTQCTPNAPPPGIRSFFTDHGAWFRPAAQRALRDSEVVDFQVREWRRRYLNKGVRAANGLGIPGEAGSILLTFVMSNPGQLRNKTARDHLVAGKAPDRFTIAGRDWRWDGTDRPARLAGVPLDEWRLLLVWQVMCDRRERIRNRNIAFFREYLSPRVSLPAMNGREPRNGPHSNCNPAKVEPAA